MGSTKKTGQDRRQEILTATCALLRANGLVATTTRDVTTRVGVGAGLLNHYFSWGELRAVALECVLRADIDAVIPALAIKRPSSALDSFIRAVFAERSDSIWRLWIETMEMAMADQALARALERCVSLLSTRLEALLRAGTNQDQWQCSDPKSSAIRIMAAHDGLVGFLLSGVPPLSRRAAAQHLRTIVGFECRGWRDA
jgi:AcrR family transcriptional regulator